MDITNEQWDRLAPLLPEPRNGPEGQGRPASDPRAVLNGILWILRTGAHWKDLPERYPPYQTCHRWFQRWRKEGVFDAILLTLAEDLRERGKLDLREAFIDGTFAPAKKGVAPLVKQNAARAPRSAASTANAAAQALDRNSFPLDWINSPYAETTPAQNELK